MLTSVLEEIHLMRRTKPKLLEQTLEDLHDVMVTIGGTAVLHASLSVDKNIPGEGSVNVLREAAVAFESAGGRRLLLPAETCKAGEGELDGLEGRVGRGPVEPLGGKPSGASTEVLVERRVGKLELVEGIEVEGLGHRLLAANVLTRLP